MAKHYRKKHPAAMKRKVGSVEHRYKRQVSSTPFTAQQKARFCPHCGGFLG
jgi:hypothetical protein